MRTTQGYERRSVQCARGWNDVKMVAAFVAKGEMDLCCENERALRPP